VTTAVRVAICVLGVTSIAACESPNRGSISPTTTVSPNEAAVADWEKWRAEENAAWKTKEFAILKIDDAVYLNNKQSAWLTNRAQNDLQYAWTLDALSAPNGLRVTYFAAGYKVQRDKHVRYRQPRAEVFQNGKKQFFTLGRDPQRVAVAPGIDVRFQDVQVEPNKNGLRVMVYNQANPLARDFSGLEHFAYNPDAVVEASFEPAAKVEGVVFQTSRGWYKRFFKMGEAVFMLEGKAVRLPMYAEDADPAHVTSLSAFFLDELSGKETYGVGRYIDVDVKGLPSKLTLDFNRAYNPNCARSPHYNCPVARDKIPVALRAGEKAPPKH
jgi:uncharacterized protein (DUF1684 family)